MASEQEGFRELLERAASGDHEAQDLICRRYERQVRIAARVLLGPLLRPHLESLDIVQSVHRSLLTGLRQSKFDVSSPEKLIALASTIAKRKVYRQWRTHRHQHLCHDAEFEQFLMSRMRSGPDSSPEKPVDDHDTVQEILARLNPTERAIMELKLDGKTFLEIAQILSSTEVAVRVRWMRLRERIETSFVG